MRVIHLIGGGDTGGAKTHVLNLLKELNQFIDARLFCFRKGDFSEDAAKMGIPIEVIESGNPIVGLRELKKRLQGEQVDIIHCHGARGNLMGNLIKRYLGAPVVTTVHSDYRLDYLGRPVARLSYGTTNMVALRRVNFYIGVSDPMTDILIERGFPADRIYTIYNGIDFKTPIHPVPKEEFLKSVGMKWEPEDVIAGIAVRLSPVKDVPTLLRAMKIACEQNPHLKLLIGGDGEDRQKLETMTQELGLSDKVCFAGWLTDVNSFYHAIDINLLTSISETFPYSLTEGTRMHRATIASRVGGVPVLIDDGVNGLIFEPGNAEQLAQHLLTLAGDKELRDTFGERIYEKASREFSIDRMVEHQLEIYESILKRDARQKSRKRDGTIICGAYGHGNAGDDAILKSIIHSVQQLDPTMPITVLAKNTQSIKKRYRVNSIYTFNLPKMFAAMGKSVLYINGGGTLIQNATSWRSLWYYLFTLRLAKLLGNKVDMYGCGIGPVNGEKNIRLVKRVLDRSVDTITLRESDSMEELKSFGVQKPEILLCSDPALVLQPSPDVDVDAYLKRHGIESGKRYLCFMLRTWYGFDAKAAAFAACADRAREQYGLEPVFLSLNIFHDSLAAQKVTQLMKTPALILDDWAEPELLMGVLGRMDAVVSMRLHGLIFSSVSGVPLVGVSYDPKIGSFLKYLDAGTCIDLPDVTPENLNDAVDQALACLPQREELKAKALKLQQVERQNIQAVARLLGISQQD
ncbi:MAG: polysaccharide pyruvyl transferase CsaB [Acutalibacter sp.]|jgi:polysaccharide pyruvyl transferase CsaB